MFQFNVENFSKCLIDYESVKELVGTEVPSLSIVKKKLSSDVAYMCVGRRGAAWRRDDWNKMGHIQVLGWSRPGAGQPALPGTDNNKQQTSRGCPRITCKVLTCLVTLLSYDP